MKCVLKNFLVGFILFNVALFSSSTIAAASQDTITFADFSWESAQLHNRIAGFIIEKGWRRDVHYMFVQEVPGFLGLERGDLQLTMEAWVDNSAYWEKAKDRHKMISLGKNYPDAPQGWYVPAYVIEGDKERGIEPMMPDLRSVKDLSRYWEMFKYRETDEKGRFCNGPSGWVISVSNAKKLKAYGLDENFTNIYTGSAAALAATIAEAYEKGEPVLAYYWEPTPLLGMYDMTKLEEPPYDEKIWKETRGCAMPESRVLKIVNNKFLESDPEICDMLKHYHTSLKLTNETLGYMQRNSTTPEEAARWFLKEHKDLWSTWIKNPKIVKRISRSLK